MLFDTAATGCCLERRNPMDNQAIVKVGYALVAAMVVAAKLIG